MRRWMLAAAVLVLLVTAGGAAGATEISYGAEYVFNSARSYETSVAALDDTHFVVAYRDFSSYYGTAIIGTVSGTTITYGAEYVFKSADTNSIAIAALDDTHFVITYTDYDSPDEYGTAIIGTVSGNTITYGAENVFNSYYTYRAAVAALDDTHFVVAYYDRGNSYYGTAIIGSVSGTTITYGAENVFYSYYTSGTAVAALDDTHFVVAYRDDGSPDEYGTAIVGSVSGTTITSYGTANVFNTATTYDIVITALDDTRFVITYTDGGSPSWYGTAIVGSVSGTTITYGAENVFNTASTYDTAITALDDTRFVVVYGDGGAAQYGTAIVGSSSGTTITNYSDAKVFNPARVAYTSVATLDATRFVATYWDYGNSYYGTAIIGVYESPGVKNLQNTVGKFWINHTWDVSGMNIIDSYNVSINGTWHNDTINTFYNNTLSTYGGWSNITVYAYNNTDGLYDNFVCEDVQLPYFLPAVPAGTGSTWNYYWVNHTWTEGSYYGIWCSDTDSYNVSVNGVWHNTTDTFYNNTLSEYGDWSNITVYAYNNTEGMNQTYIYQNVKIPHFIPPTPINLQHTIYNCSINNTWESGTGYITDSYNVSITTTFCGEVTTDWYTTTSPAHSFIVTCDGILPTIAVYAYNNTHHAQSTENVTETITTPLPSTDITDIDFETGYTLGTLNSQQGWACSAGAGSPVIEVHGIDENRYAGIRTTDADCYAYAQHSIDGWGASKELYIYFNFEISGYGAGDDAFAIAPSGWGGSPTNGDALLAVRCRCDTSPPYMTINVYNGTSLLYSTSAASGWHSMEAVYNGETGMFTTLKLDGNDIANKNARPIEDFPSPLYICCWANLLGGFSGDYRIGIDDIYIYPIGTFGCYGCEVDCGFHSIVVSDKKNNPIQNADISIYDSTDNEYIQKWVQDDDGIIPLRVFFYGGHTVQVGINTFDGVFIRDIYIDPDGGVSNITIPLNYNLKVYPEDQNGVPLTGVFAGLAEYTPLDPLSFWGFSMSGSQHVPVTNCSGFSMCDIIVEKGGYETYEETALNWTSKSALVKDYRHTTTLIKE